jgi:hypothetical protein
MNTDRKICVRFWFNFAMDRDKANNFANLPFGAIITAVTIPLIKEFVYGN